MNRKLRMGWLVEEQMRLLALSTVTLLYLTTKLNLFAVVLAWTRKFQKNRVNFIIYPIIVYMKHIKKCSKEEKPNFLRVKRWILFRSSPNFVHFEPAMMALENGFHVVLEKPMTFTLEEALKLKEKLRKPDLSWHLPYLLRISCHKTCQIYGNLWQIGKNPQSICGISTGLACERRRKARQYSSCMAYDPKRSGKAGCMGDIVLMPTI